MRAVARINDAPCGRVETILVLDDAGDAWAPVATLAQAALVAELWGLDPGADLDWSEVGELPR
jgi:hypothetical protein